MNKIFSKSRIGLVINWDHHKKNRWVSALTHYLVERIINDFDPIIITNQFSYSLNKHRLKSIISMEPGWAAPMIKYGKGHGIKIVFFASDPHNKKDWLEDYVNSNDISYILSYYFSPFFYHFPKFPKEKFIHFPWSIPDNFISNQKLKVYNNGVSIFGGTNCDAYDVRNWCRTFNFVTSYENSGVENKVHSDEEYFSWLSGLDAVIAAGSSLPKYDLVTPKYFEIAASGSLLIGQHCTDLGILGFNKNNSLIFTKDTFQKTCFAYLKNPHMYMQLRENGRLLIKQEHTLSKRINLLADIIQV